ncbi:glycosyl hydrolase family 18 protein [Candidatus Protochlamydia phocaeensis]|uniref:glycosyl hydrolase family 18 protein n=1 Tax=Candidatus Protochlamydia phocaeensis TaxID=1414722 RepID=UPI0008395B1F|nr:glycosyl hydrolase family 18 protein [Candidatus Protochlamydia phocaeensis]
MFSLLRCCLFPFLFLALISLFFTVGLSASTAIIAAYYANDSHSRPPIGNRPPFTVDRIDPSLLTDLYVAFAAIGYVSASIEPDHPRLTGDFTLQPTMKEDKDHLYPQLVDLKKRSKKPLRLFLSIGGWNFNNPEHSEGKTTYRLFSQMVSTAENRKQFITSAIDFAHRYGFDGIDIDWEYPGDPARGGSERDFNNFPVFLKECSAAFSQANPPLLLSFTAPAFIPFRLQAHFQADPSRFYKWLADCAQFVDRINIMAYDYHGPFDVPRITGVNAPLNQDTDRASPLYIAKTLQNYLDNGVPAQKMVLGLPLFGHIYAGVSVLQPGNTGPGKPFETGGAPGPATREKGMLAYYEIADKMAQKQLSFGSDPVTSTVYGYNFHSQEWASFDNPDTIKLKAMLALTFKLKGVFFWSIDLDEYQWEPKFPNIRSARQVFSESRE